MERVTGARTGRVVRAPGMKALVSAVCRAYELKERDLANPARRRKPAEARAVIGWLASKQGVATLTEVAAKFNREVSALSHAVRGVEARLGESASFRRYVGRIENSITQA